MARERTGHLEFRGGSWWARVSIRVDGKRQRRRYDLGTADEETARKKMAKLIERVPAVEIPKPARALTFDAWAAGWLKRRAAAGVAMVDSERGWIKIYASPTLGPKLLGDVRPRDVRAVLDAVVGAGRMKQTVSHVRATLSRCFREAVEQELLERSPVADVRTPRIREVRKERAILRDDEFLQLLACSDVELEIRVAALASRVQGGMRTRDLTAWDWSMIELPSMARCIVPRTKTLKPQRLEIPDVLQPSLRAWWRGAGEPTSGPVFPVTKGKRKGEARKTRGVSFAKRLRRALLVAGINRHELHHETETSLPVDFHSGRRAFRSALERAGVSDQRAMLLGGWEDPRAAARYVMTPDEALRIPAAALPSVERKAATDAGECEVGRKRGRTDHGRGGPTNGSGQSDLQRHTPATAQPAYRHAGPEETGPDERGIRAGACVVSSPTKGAHERAQGHDDPSKTSSGTRGSNSRPSAWEADDVGEAATNLRGFEASATDVQRQDPHGSSGIIMQRDTRGPLEGGAPMRGDRRAMLRVLGEQLMAAMDAGDLGAARVAHAALGELLGSARGRAADVIDLADERGRRGGGR